MFEDETLDATTQALRILRVEECMIDEMRDRINKLIDGIRYPERRADPNRNLLNDLFKELQELRVFADQLGKFHAKLDSALREVAATAPQQAAPAKADPDPVASPLPAINVGYLDDCDERN